jgi:hypothetical protein
MLWKYLEHYGSYFDSRKSSIYKNQSRFAMFGVGPYSFTPYKVAICGLYKKLVFTVVGPINGKPVMVDDTAYFLPCMNEDEARMLADVLNGLSAHQFFEARVFWDMKRPINKGLLQSLSLDALLRENGRSLPSRIVRTHQCVPAL